MTTWPRLVRAVGTVAAAMLVLAIGASRAADAQPSPAERANQLNEEGKELYRKADLDGAVNKFRQAIVLSPEGRFYFNLCYIYEEQGKLREALTACEAVKPNGADDRLIKKTDTLIARITPRVPARPPAERPKPAPPPVDPTSDPVADPNGDPNVTADPNTDPNADPVDPNTDPSFVADPNGATTTGPADAPPQGPPDGIIQAPPPPAETYRWSAGIGFGAVSSAVGAEDAYGSSGGQIRLHADFLIFKNRMMGVSPYLHITQIASGGGFVNDSLDIVDVGGAIYKHIPFRGFEITPIGGAHLAFLQPESFNDRVNMVTLGLRGEVSASKAFGTKLQHILSVSAGLNLYFPASGGGNADPSNYGLDVAGSTVVLSIGYTHRFTTPFGRTPLITLE